MVKTEITKSTSHGPIAAALAIALIGVATGYFFGRSVIIPLGGTALAWWLASRNFVWWKRPIIPAFAIQSGHLIWLGLGAAYTGMALINSIDVLILVAGLTWLAVKPSRGPIYLLATYQLLTLYLNSVIFFDAATWVAANKALLIHVIWRVVALLLMIKLFLEMRTLPKTERRFTIHPVTIDRRRTVMA